MEQLFTAKRLRQIALSGETALERLEKIRLGKSFANQSNSQHIYKVC